MGPATIAEDGWVNITVFCIASAKLMY